MLKYPVEQRSESKTLKKKFDEMKSKSNEADYLFTVRLKPAQDVPIGLKQRIEPPEVYPSRLNTVARKIIQEKGTSLQLPVHISPGSKSRSP